MKQVTNKFFENDKVVYQDWKFALKTIRNSIKSFGCKVNLCLTPKRRYNNVKYNVSICAVFKNEAKYLREWLEFNSIAGIEHFYLYNNNSDDNYLEVLNPYITSGIVTLIDWPKNQAQMECYKTCIQNYSNETKWLGFIDIDEFIIPNTTNTIYEFLKNKENQPSVLIYWKLFGTSGKISRNENDYVSQDFTVCWKKYCMTGKCFYNTAFKFYDDINGINRCLHHRFYSKGVFGKISPMNIFGKFCITELHNPVEKNYVDCYFPIQINHYFTKSFDEYVEKSSKGDVYFTNNPHNLDYFYEHEGRCQSVDYSAYKYLIQLKRKMEQK